MRRSVATLLATPFVGGLIACGCWIPGPEEGNTGDCLTGSFSTCETSAIPTSGPFGYSALISRNKTCTRYTAQPGAPFILAPCGGGAPASGYENPLGAPCGTTTSQCCWI